MFFPSFFRFSFCSFFLFSFAIYIWKNSSPPAGDSSAFRQVRKKKVKKKKERKKESKEDERKKKKIQRLNCVIPTIEIVLLKLIFYMLTVLIGIISIQINTKLILNATYRKPVCSVGTAHVGTTAREVEVACVSTTYRTRPIVAVATNIVERASTVVAEACNR